MSIQKIGKGLIMNQVQKVRYYRDLSLSNSFELLFFDPRGLNWDKRTITGLRLKGGQWEKGNYNFPSVFYNRCYPRSRQLTKKLGELVGHSNIFNFETQLDKWEVYNCLLETSVEKFLPRTYQYSKETLGHLIEKHDDLILKPRRGSGGANVYLLTRLSPDWLTISSHLNLKLPLIDNQFCPAFLLQLAPSKRFIAQQYIHFDDKKDNKFDIRVLVQKNCLGEWEITGQLSRITRKTALLTNDFLAILDPQELLKGEVLTLMHEISESVAFELEKKLGSLGEIGVDFILDSTAKPWILEVNGKPDKSLFRQLKDEKMMEKIYLNPLDYLRFLQKAKAGTQ